MFGERFNQLRNQNKFTDCCFEVEGKSFLCHKLILSASSEVFEAMLMQPYFCEGQNDSKISGNVIKVTDISYETFNDFLNYLYTGEIHVEMKTVDELIKLCCAANKYMVKSLIEKCIEEISKEINFGRVLEIAQKSFDNHLEEIIINCLYFLAEHMEGGSSLLNEFLTFPLDSLCFEFIIKNLLDYFPPANDIVGVIKSWIISQSRLDEKKICNQRFLLDSLSLDVETCEKVLNLKACHFNVKNEKIFKVFRRHYYKPVSPYIVEPSQMFFQETISFKKFVILKSLLVNSRYISDSDTNVSSYCENVNLSLIEVESNSLVYERNHVIENVIFNDIFQLDLVNHPLILFPDHLYKMKISWLNESIGFEYPRSIFSTKENEINRKQQIVATFHESQFLSRGSIVQGISYEIIS